MMPSKYYRPNCIYEDRAGTRYAITFKPDIKGYHMVRLTADGDTIANSGVVFHKWIKELRLIGPREE